MEAPGVQAFLLPVSQISTPQEGSGVRAVAVLSGLPRSLLEGNDVLAVNTEGLNQPPQVAPDRQKDVSKTADRTADGERGGSHSLVRLPEHGQRVQ